MMMMMYRVHTTKPGLVGGAAACQADLEPQIHAGDGASVSFTKRSRLETADKVVTDQFEAGLAKVPRKSTSESVSTRPRSTGDGDSGSGRCVGGCVSGAGACAWQSKARIG